MSKVNGQKRNRSANNTKGGNPFCREKNPCHIGSYRQVFHGSAMQTVGGLTKEDIVMNKRGRLVSKRKHLLGLKIFRRQPENLLDYQRQPWKKGQSGKSVKKSSKKTKRKTRVIHDDDDDEVNEDDLPLRGRPLKKCPRGTRRNRKTLKCVKKSIRRSSTKLRR